MEEGEVTLTNMENKECLFTIILDYLGGTYISQVTAQNIDKAIRNWIRALEVETIDGFTNSDKENLIEVDFIDDKPALIDNMFNVWCITIRTKQGLGIVNIIKTA